MKYFKENEFVGFDILRPEMKTMLDELRERLGRPILITSSFRTVQHNKDIGGAANSSHLLAPDGFYSGIDFTIPGGLITPRALFQIVGNAYTVGFRRIGLYQDMRHIHLDCELTSDQNVMWINS